MLLGFNKQFIVPILDGTKRLTIRNPRKNEPKPGEKIYMYTGLRTKHCKKITDKYIYIGSQKITIIYYPAFLTIIIDGKFLKDEDERRDFFNLDGFETEAEFLEYWIKSKQLTPVIRGGLFGVFTIYHWTDKRF